MFKTIANAWKLADLRKKILCVLFIIFLYRIGTAIPVPYVNPAITSELGNLSEGIFAYLGILTGGAFSQATLFALGISPYITASIVIQLLTIAIPYLENKSKEGEEGRKWLNQLTRIVTIALAIVTAIGYFQLLKSQSTGGTTTPMLLLPGGKWDIFAAAVMVACYCAGSALVMWLAEKINEHGIGNGISVILFANIVASAPAMVSNLYKGFIKIIWDGSVDALAPKIVLPIIAAAVVIVSIASVFFIVFITDSERRLPVQYAKKVVGRKMYGGQSSTLPLKLNMTGVMPMIFANSIVTLPITIAMFIPKQKVQDFVNQWFGTDTILYAVLTAVLIVAFAYFYVTISFNPVEVANNLKKNGGFIPGIRPGKPTSDYITKVLNRITLIGALFLDVIAVLPLVANIVYGFVAKAADFPATAQLSALAFTGSSIIIVVGVVVETAREIESQMTMRHYKGFLE